jgi:predicted PurR-regulated permease PerM
VKLHWTHHTLSTQEKPLPTPKPIWTEQTPNTIRGHILFAVCVILTLALAWRLRDVLTLVYVSGLFAVVLMPVVRGIMRFEMRGGRHISRGLAIAILLSFVFLILAAFLTIALPPVIHDIHQFAADLPARIPSIVAKIKHFPMADQLGVDSLTQKAENALSATAEYLFASVPMWAGRIFDLITALVLCVYFMLEGDHAYQWFMSLFSVEKRLRLAVTLEKAEIRMSRWLFGQGLLMLILGVCSTIVFGLLHVRYFFLLGVLMGLMNIIPIAGGIITIAVVGAVAALDSWSKMAAVFAFYLFYVNVENAYLTPRIMRSSVDLMGLAVLIALIAGVDLAGVVGALVAVPTAALVAVLMDEYVVQNDYSPPDDNPPQETIGN